MRRYEMVEGTSSKFWEIALEGTSFTTRFGRIGTDGQVSTKEWKNADEAQRQYDKIVQEKEKKGYTLVSGGDGKKGGASAKAAAAKPKSIAKNPALQKAIESDPQSPDGYLVYGDWLNEQGDPLGELVAVQSSLAKKPDDATLKKKEKELFRNNAESWLGILTELQKEKNAALVWQNGFIARATLGGDEYCDQEALDVWKGLRKLPTAQFIRDLELRMFADEGEFTYADVIKAMAKDGLPPTLRRLAFDVRDSQVSWTALGDLSKLYPQLERLEELRIQVGKMKLGDIVLPGLRRFEVLTGGLTKDNLRSILAAKWPALEALTLYFGDPEYGGNCKLADLQPILDGKNLAKVKHLGLCNSEFADDLAKIVGRAKITKQLESLDLSKGIMSDAGADALVEAAKSLAHLKKLDLSENYISKAGVKKLKAAFGNVVEAGKQNEGDEDDGVIHRYVTIAE